MNTEQIQKLAIDALNDIKAIDLVTLDVSDLTTVTDTMIICTGRSNRHVKSLAENVVFQAKQHKHDYIKMEGEKEGEWIIVDLASVVVHIMLPSARSFYNLEDLWEPIADMREQHAHSSSGRR
jgi:ribosome-associated protein